MILCSSAECVDHTSAMLRVLLLKQHHTKHFGCDFPDLPSSLELEYLECPCQFLAGLREEEVASLALNTLCCWRHRSHPQDLSKEDVGMTRLVSVVSALTVCCGRRNTCIGVCILDCIVWKWEIPFTKKIKAPWILSELRS